MGPKIVLICYISSDSNEYIFIFLVSKLILTDMGGAKARKKDITKKLKKGATELSASKDKAADFLVCLCHITICKASQCSRKKH